jgi:hypothetical protein
MRKVDEIGQLILELTGSELAELREWFSEQDWAVWDKQIESDEAAGKLKSMVSEAQAEFYRRKPSSGGSNMSTAKEELTRLIESQPADSTREEIVRELAFHVMVGRGLADSDTKQVVSNDEMASRIRTWRK